MEVVIYVIYYLMFLLMLLNSFINHWVVIYNSTVLFIIGCY